MGIQDLQKFIETHCQQACKPVDLVQIARGVCNKPAKGKRRENSLKLIVDAESCLDRLYGGYFSDWVCGGQWNRMTNFLSTLMQACHSSNMELVVFFNGAVENSRLQEWNKQQRKQKQNIGNVMRHISNKGTPPPKIWWSPPAGLQCSLRMALRQLGVTVACSTEDNHQEVIAYCRENFFHGILAQDADFIIFDPPRYFASEHLKLTYKGAIETQEYVVDDIARTLDLDPKRFAVLATLLGTHFVPEEELREFYCKICNLGSPAEAAKLSAADIINPVVSFVRGLESVENPEELGREVFKNAIGNIDDKVSRFKQSIHYYIRGTQEGFIKYRPKASVVPSPVKQPGSYQSKQDAKKRVVQQKDLSEKNVYAQSDSGYGAQAQAQAQQTTGELEGALDKEIAHQMNEDLEEKMANMSLDKPAEDEADSTSAPAGSVIEQQKGSKRTNNQAAKKSDKPGPVSTEVLRTATGRHQEGLMSPWVYQLLAQGELKIPITMEEELSRELPQAVEVFRPIRQRVYAVLFDLHKNLAEYRKTLKNSDSQKNAPERPQVTIKEWMVPAITSANSGLQCDHVRALPLEWTVPGIQRLWMGIGPEEKGRRIKTFLGCMSCDVNGDDNMLVNTSYVPQHLVILCCVLRHMVHFCKNGMRILRKHELDAFLATAVSPLLHDVETMQDMKLPAINNRGVQLAAMFMRGVEHAIFANDACGSPIPWHVCCPWLFFDGKLFHFKLLKANNNTPLIDICDGHMDQVMRVERMRQAILQAVINPEMIFAKPILPLMHNPYAGGRGGGMGPPMYPPHVNFHPGGGHGPNHHHHGPGGRGVGRGRGLLGKSGGIPGRSPVDSRGGQLQIAGVVVGNWGPNTQAQGQHRPGRMDGRNTPPPQVMSVGPGGPRRGMNRGVVSSRVSRGRAGRYAPQSRGGNRMQPQPYDNYSDREQKRLLRGRGRPMGRSMGQGHGQYQNQYEGPGNNQANDFTKVTLEQRSQQQGIGRGCTVETAAEGSSVMSVSELMRGTDNVPVTQPPSHSHQPPPHHSLPQQPQSPHSLGATQQIQHPLPPPQPHHPIPSSHDSPHSLVSPQTAMAPTGMPNPVLPSGLPGSMQTGLQGMGDIGQFEDPQAQAHFNAAAAAMIEMNKIAASQMGAGSISPMAGMAAPPAGPIHMNGVNGNLGPGDLQ